MEKEDSGENEVQASLKEAAEVSQGSNLAFHNKPLVSQTETSLLKMMEKTTQFMGELTQEVFPRDNFKYLAFKNPLMKEPESFDGTQSFQ
ncbi:hypothetical protein O181_078583 [Austropuccinia psidii MF-1]|uniref:Uncharacterized protein n=1 Tax=Austropuccinia psidii MF-1 TaxID=1389203 RepID=A0A9Q3IES6_9BASI|nr:hypothetical protein [Austropuccinia psidii MF-1]